jgi:putative addiction module component (TIGR02574 family)
MTKQTQSILDEAVKLPAAEKLVLVEAILTSLAETDEDWNKAWGKEAGARMAEYTSGKVEAIDADEVFAELKSGLE